VIAQPSRTAHADATVTASGVSSDIARGELQPGDADVQALTCWSIVHGLSMLIVNGPVPVGAGKAQRQLIEQRLRVLGTGLYAPIPSSAKR